MASACSDGKTTARGGAALAFAAPPLDLEPPSAAELDALFRGGEADADLCERVLASAARACGAIDVQLAEGLAALGQGNRLAELGCHLDDYAREALDLGKSAAEKLARLGVGLRTRPLLREALRSARVRLRAAQTVLPVAVGGAEAAWVERAAWCTVRELESAVRRARRGKPEPEPEEEWVRLGVRLEADERLVVDAAFAVAAEVLPGSTRTEQLEAMSQEALADLAALAEDPATPRALGPAFRALSPGERTRRAALEVEMERWASLALVPDWPAPGSFDDATTADEIDERLRAHARLRARWDAIVGYCAAAVKRGRLHLRLGFANFRHYVDERLSLDGKAVEQRAALEQRIWASPALQEARRQGLSYERLRLLAPLPQEDIAGWISPAKALTVIALRRTLAREAERKMRTSGRMGVAMPRSVAAVVAAAIDAARRVAGAALSPGRCLAFLATRFLEVWRPLVNPSRTRSRKVRDRDGGCCQVPGCSRRATHAHHIAFRSHGGGDEPENQVGLCAFHHLRCIHGGTLRVFGRAPDALVWFRGGKVRGPGC
jgi:hypothetical protein